MLMRSASPTQSPLPWSERPADSRRNHAGNIKLDPLAVAGFDDLVHSICPEARHVDADRIATLARWLQDLPDEQARAVLDERLERIEQLRVMLADPDWDHRPDACDRIRRLLAYLDQGHDLIPDRIPVLGLLDDVLLLELAWPAIATEADDYRDFCRFRDEQPLDGRGTHQREAWVRERLHALALFQHHQRVNGSRYAASGALSPAFHVA